MLTIIEQVVAADSRSAAAWLRRRPGHVPWAASPGCRDRSALHAVRGAARSNCRHPRVAADHRPDHLFNSYAACGPDHVRSRPRRGRGDPALRRRPADGECRVVPKIQGDAVELHPSLVIFVLIVGGAIGGLLGAILAIPITAAGRDVYRYLFRRLSDARRNGSSHPIHRRPRSKLRGGQADRPKLWISRPIPRLTAQCKVCTMCGR